MEIDGQIVGLNSDSYQKLRGRGFMFYGQDTNENFGFSTQVVVMELNIGNNNTKVACIGADDTDGTRHRADIFTPNACMHSNNFRYIKTW